MSADAFAAPVIVGLSGPATHGYLARCASVGASTNRACITVQALARRDVAHNMVHCYNTSKMDLHSSGMWHSTISDASQLSPLPDWHDSMPSDSALRVERVSTAICNNMVHQHSTGWWLHARACLLFSLSYHRSSTNYDWFPDLRVLLSPRSAGASSPKCRGKAWRQQQHWCMHAPVRQCSKREGNDAWRAYRGSFGPPAATPIQIGQCSSPPPPPDALADCAGRLRDVSSTASKYGNRVLAGSPITAATARRLLWLTCLPTRRRLVRYTCDLPNLATATVTTLLALSPAAGPPGSAALVTAARCQGISLYRP